MSKRQKITIIKASGERQPFSENKLIRSLARAGAAPQQAENIARTIAASTRSGTHTSEIYDRAMRMLKSADHPLAARYSLKQALLTLGPSGHPFEDFIGEIFKLQGYSVSLRQNLQGKCGRHEVDVVGRKAGEHIIVETKFHNSNGFKTDIKVALYVHARYQDIVAGSSRKSHLHEAWLVTNTKFTKDAIDYAECVGLRLLGWNYPSKGNIQEIIESKGLLPLTTLTTITSSQKKSLIDDGVILCSDMRKKRAQWQKYGISRKDDEVVWEELEAVCKI